MSEFHYEVTDDAGRVWEWDDYENRVAHFARYCYLCPETKGREGIVARTVELGRGVSVDYDADGRALGIEFL